jgi:hypothetical protein
VLLDDLPPLFPDAVCTQPFLQPSWNSAFEIWPSLFLSTMAKLATKGTASCLDKPPPSLDAAEEDPRFEEGALFEEGAVDADAEPRSELGGIVEPELTPAFDSALPAELTLLLAEELPRFELPELDFDCMLEPAMPSDWFRAWFQMF